MPDITHKAQFSDDTEVVDATMARYPVRCRLSDTEYRALLDLLMCSDPWPVDSDDHDWTHDEITRLVDREALARGYADWVVAYHEHKAGPGTQLTLPLAAKDAKDAKGGD